MDSSAKEQFCRLVDNGASIDELLAEFPGSSRDAIKQRRLRHLWSTGHGATAVTAKDLTAAGDSVDVNGDNVKLTRTSTEMVKTLDDLIRVCDIDTSIYAIDRFTCKAWNGFIKNSSKQIEKTQLYAVTAFLRVKHAENQLRSDVDDILSDLKVAAPELLPPPSVLSRPSSGMMLELSIPDAHFGKLAWWRECGESYDVKIAQTLFVAAVDDLLAKTAGYEFDEINLIVGNDLLNSDNFENTTAKGTPQSTDGRQAKTFSVVRETLQSVIRDRLIGRAPKVNVVIVPGNHDRQTSFYLGEVLDAYFSNSDSVRVDNSPTLRKYIQFGDVLLMFTHGSDEKHSSLPLIMATERPDLWGATRFREIHLGHLHQRRASQFLGVSEYNGVCVRILPSLSAPEDWHTAKGYVGNIRSAEAYIWDRNTGLVGTAMFNVPIHSAA